MLENQGTHYRGLAFFLVIPLFARKGGPPHSFSLRFFGGLVFVFVTSSGDEDADRGFFFIVHL